MTFGAHNLVRSEPFLAYRCELWQLLQALRSYMRKKNLYRCTSTFLALKYRKTHRNRPINRDALFVRTMHPRTHNAPDSERNNKQTPHFRTNSRRTYYEFPQTLYSEWGRRDH